MDIVMEQITGYIESIVYLNSENGFVVAKLKENDKDQLIIIVGSIPSIQVGESIQCQGDWKYHNRFGKQFEVKDHQIKIPADLMAIKKYLESGLIKGIGPVYAQKIIKYFKEDTLKIIDETPKALLEISGIGKKRVDIIIKCWQEQKHVRDVMIFLRSCNVSPAYAQKIYKTYGNESIERVKQNPYQLAFDITGIGFKMADSIAINLGFELTSEKRIEAGIEHVLWEMTSHGHTCFPKIEFLPQAQSILDVHEDLICNKLDKLIKSKKVEVSIINTDDGKKEFIFLRSMFFYEKSIANHLNRIKNSKSSIRDVFVEKAITWVQEKFKIKLANMQLQAVESAIKDKMHIITGGPGTGKSTITNAILAILEKVTGKILLAAPTGRAAKRLMEITRKKAFTIHSLLEYDFTTGGFKKNIQNPLKCNLLIIDEASMIDTSLMFHLLSAIPDTTRVIFVGDIDQLPSVGPGNVLRDIIASNAISVTYLDRIYRQAAGSKIILNAHKINKGEFPYLDRDEMSDFLYIESKEPQDILNLILSLVKDDIPKNKKFDPIKDIQVLSPMKKGIIGIENLNRSLQNLLNPSKNPLIRAGMAFHVNDKVMQIKNNYDKDVFNGDVGKIVGIDRTEQEIEVNFDDKIVVYDFSELDELVLAYAVSVHKYQGSECPCIVIPIHTTHFKLLYRNLLYTAITRGKKYVVIVGTKKALAIAIKNNEVKKRYTALSQAIKVEFSKPFYETMLPGDRESK
jgi:exodeoxyribonuclease V alpha subunit